MLFGMLKQNSKGKKKKNSKKSGADTLKTEPVIMFKAPEDRLPNKGGA